MVAVNTKGSTAYRRQFNMTSSKTTISFASMFAAGNAAGGVSDSMAGFFSDSANESMLSRIYEQMTGRPAGPDAGIRASANGGAVDTSRPFNAASKGGHELTAGEIEALRAKYDVNNLTNQERYDLLRELTDMGVLTAGEAESAGKMAVIETVTFSFSFTCSVASVQTDGDDKETLLEHLMRMLEKERGEFASLLDLMGNPDGDMYRVAAAKIEASITHHEKVAAVIEKLGEPPAE